MSSQEQYSQALRQSQEAMTRAVESWTQGVQRMLGQTSGAPGSPVASPEQVIDQVFDFATRMLEAQREFAKNLAGASTSATESLRQQAEDSAEALRQQARSQGS